MESERMRVKVFRVMAVRGVVEGLRRMGLV
jgi:hypothetical protein